MYLYLNILLVFIGNFYFLEGVSQAGSDSTIYTRILITPDSILVGNWEGTYMDFNLRMIPVTLYIDSSYDEHCSGTLLIKVRTTIAHGKHPPYFTIPFLANRKGNHLTGSFRHIFDIKFSLRSFRVFNLRSNMTRWVLEGTFEEPQFSEYTKGPVMLWKKAE